MASASPASAVVSTVAGAGGGVPWARARPGAIHSTAAATAAATVHHRTEETRSVLVKVALDGLRVLGLQKRELQQHTRLAGVELDRGDRAQLVVVELDVAADDAAVRARRA